MSILRKFVKTNLSYKLIWLLVIFSILLNLIGTQYELSGYNLRTHPYIGILLVPFDNVRYGHFIARKLFLVVTGFLVFAYWLKTKKGILTQIISNLKYIITIGVTLLVTRILTFGFWFYNDDTRFFSWQLAAPAQANYDIQGMWGPISLHPIAIFPLVIRWFGTNYVLYNALGLFLYFLAGVAIFALISKLQKSKFISLIAAIFFLTTPTYFQGRLLIGEIMNSPFVLLLVLLSIYLLLQKFIPGALIFAAAALEYGVAKTYFIALPLTLFSIFFTDRKKNIIFFVAAIWLISLVYKPAFAGAPAAGSIGQVFTLDHLLVFGDVLSSVTLPYGFLYPLVRLTSQVVGDWVYLTAAIGFLTIAIFVFIGFVSYLKGRIITSKLILIGLSIVLPCAAIGSLFGVRIDRNIQKLVEYHNNSSIPMGATGYGFFPALGLMLVLVSLGYLIKPKLFKIFAVLLILVNIISSFIFDYEWLQSSYAYPQRQYNEQLQKILPRDGVNKYVYVPSKQRPLYQGVGTFGDIFQGDQRTYLFMDPDEFVSALEKDKPKSDHVYFLITSGKPDYHIFDYSDKLRSASYDNITPLLDTLTKQLTPNPTYF